MIDVGSNHWSQYMSIKFVIFIDIGEECDDLNIYLEGGRNVLKIEVPKWVIVLQDYNSFLEILISKLIIIFCSISVAVVG